jgi:hypothetical protein
MKGLEVLFAYPHRLTLSGRVCDSVVKRVGNRQDYSMRASDNRLERFINRDPLVRTYHYISPYQLAANCLITMLQYYGDIYSKFITNVLMECVIDYGPVKK